MAKEREWLKQIRKEKGYTGPKIAKELNISHSTWYGYESGYRTPNGYDALRIAKLLDFDMELFFNVESRDTRKERKVM